MIAFAVMLVASALLAIGILHLTRSSILASIGAAAAGAVLFQFANFLLIGRIDPFYKFVMIVCFVASFVINIVVLLIYESARRRDDTNGPRMG